MPFNGVKLNKHLDGLPCSWENSGLDIWSQAAKHLDLSENISLTHPIKISNWNRGVTPPRQMTNKYQYENTLCPSRAMWQLKFMSLWVEMLALFTTSLWSQLVVSGRVIWFLRWFSLEISERKLGYSHVFFLMCLWVTHWMPVVSPQSAPVSIRLWNQLKTGSSLIIYFCWGPEVSLTSLESSRIC